MRGRRHPDPNECIAISMPHRVKIWSRHLMSVEMDMQMESVTVNR